MTTIRVFNLHECAYGPSYVGISPREAVIAAYAQSKGDFNTWDYAKYEPFVMETNYTVMCGPFSAMLA